MALLPSNISYGYVTGRFISAVADTEDPDAYPDGVPVTGIRITFRSSITVAKNRSATPPVTIFFNPVQCITDADGDLVDSQGSKGVYLVASDDPDISPTNFTYQVTIEPPAGTTFPSMSFNMAMPSDGEVDLTTVVPVPTKPGDTLQDWLQAVTDARAAAADAEEYATTAESVYAAKGTPGGIAALDDDGDVIDAEGNKVVGSGPQGESAYEIALANGFVGSETEWLASLHGEDGVTPDTSQFATAEQGAKADTAVQSQPFFEDGIRITAGDGSELQLHSNTRLTNPGTTYIQGGDTFTAVVQPDGQPEVASVQLATYGSTLFGLTSSALITDGTNKVTVSPSGTVVTGPLTVEHPESDYEAATKEYVDSKAGNLAPVATSGDYADLIGAPVLGTAASEDTTSFATSSQGAKADSAVQPADLSAYVPTTRTVAGKPLSADVAITASDVGAATAAQGAKADTAIQPAALTKDAVGLGNVDNTADMDKPVSTAQQAAITAASGGSGSTFGTVIKFSTLPGANDDAKLSAGISAIQTPTYKGRTIILDENRTYVFTQQVIVPSGFSIMGSFRPQDQPRSSKPIASQVNLRMAGASSGKGWLKIGAGNTFGISVTNLSIDGDINSALFDGSEDNGGVLWTTVFRDISIQNAKSVLGTKANKLVITACTLDGWWNINNIRERAWHIGGSDYFSAPSMMLVDSPPSVILSRAEFLQEFGYLSNAWIRNIYCTTDSASGVRFYGSDSTSQSQWFETSVVEGRNPNHPAVGALVRLDGGQVMIRGCRFAYAMGNPDLNTARKDKGAIHVSKGNAVIQDCTYERGNVITSWTAGTDDPTVGGPQGEDVPFVYVEAGAKVRIRNIVSGGPVSGDRSWTGKPIAKQAIDGLIDADDSVTVVTVQTATMLTTASDYATGIANTGTSVTVNKPTNLADGDLLVAALYGRNNTAAYTTPPTGWTEQAPSSENTAIGVLRVYTKQITSASGEPASYTWAGGVGGRHVGIIGRVKNAPTTSAVDAKGAVALAVSGPPPQVIVPGVTTTSELDMLFIVAVANGTGGSSPTYTSPAGVTPLTSVQTSTGSSESSMTVAFQPAVAVGATGSRSMLSANGVDPSSGGGYMIAIKSKG